MVWFGLQRKAENRNSWIIMFLIDRQFPFSIIINRFRHGENLLVSLFIKIKWICKMHILYWKKTYLVTDIIDFLQFLWRKGEGSISDINFWSADIFVLTFASQTSTVKNWLANYNYPTSIFSTFRYSKPVFTK